MYNMYSASCQSRPGTVVPASVVTRINMKRWRTRFVSRSKHAVGVIKPVLYREVIPFYSEVHAKPINTLFEQNLEFLNFKLDDPCMLSFEGLIFSC